MTLDRVADRAVVLLAERLGQRAVERFLHLMVIEDKFAAGRAHESVTTFLERILMMPTLIVVEDGHWLDDASRFLLVHLAAKPAVRPWMICVTTRPGAAS